MTSKPASTKKVQVLPPIASSVPNKRKLQSSIKTYAPDRKVLEVVGSVSGAIERIKCMVTQAEGAYRAVLNYELAQACGVAEYLIESREEWLKFCQDPIWAYFVGRRPKEDDPFKALLFVLVRIFPIPAQKVGKRASKFYNALAPYVRQQVPVTEIPAKIKMAHGTGSLARRNARSAPVNNGRLVRTPLRQLSDKIAVSGARREPNAGDTSGTEPPAPSDDYLNIRMPLDGKSEAILDSPKPCVVMLLAELVQIDGRQFEMKLLAVGIRKTKEAA